MKLFNIPIESLEERYSKQWNDNFPKEFNKRIMEWANIYPFSMKGMDKITRGQFLDVVNTNKFKARQLAEICDLFNHNKVKDGDVFFFHDLWFPGIESLFYIRDALKINFRICGMLHAGTYDPHDYLAQCGMARWGKRYEESIFNEVDLIFVATNFHKQLLLSNRAIWISPKIKVTGFPLWDNGGYDLYEKENIIVFPHRLAPEKAPEEFDELAKQCKGRQGALKKWKFYKTKDIAKTKQEYFGILRKSKIALSFARQETWGIAQQEAMFRGCLPLIPNRLSYKEMYDPLFIYKNRGQLEHRLALFTKDYEKIVSSSTFTNNLTHLKYKNNNAVNTMLDTIRCSFLEDQT